MTTLPLPDSLWAATANAAPETSQLAGDVTVDVAIIGGGFTGLRAALVLAEAGASVAVVDAGDIGWGCLRRNGGQVNPIGHPAVIAQRWHQKYGADYAQRYIDMPLHSADELFDLIRKHDIHCDAEQNGRIRAVHGDTALSAFEEMARGWQSSGADLHLIDAAELEHLSGSRAYKSGWLATRGGSVQPLSYTRGLAQAALSAGATIYTQSRINQLTRHGAKWQLASDRGNIFADQVILGTNGYTDGLIPGLRESIVPVVSIQAATRPLTAEQNAQILKQRNTLSDTRRMINYFKKTADNRLVFGSAGTAGEVPGIAERRRIIAGLRTVYPQFPDLELEYIWGGQIAVTQDHLPHVHQIAPGLLAGLGCNGRGVALSTVMGRLLAEMALGKGPRELPIPLSQIQRYPFHRFHRVGIKLAVAWKQICDKHEAGH
ncbi:MAG: glycine/D-amino acid oxidase-like deaminating enzyme [Gammaproteobacteria bacterium]|jgi:glycine/D-amino acid oxidase-like deaminating enzyme